MIKKFIWGILFAIAAVIVVAWLTQDQWLPQWNQELAEESVEYRERGLSLGETANQQSCLDEALASFNTCSGFACTIKHGKFLKACLEVASPAKGFCDEVPEFNEEPTEDDKSWARHYCWDRDIRGEGCRLLMRQQQLFCSQQ